MIFAPIRIPPQLDYDATHSVELSKKLKAGALDTFLTFLESRNGKANSQVASSARGCRGAEIAVQSWSVVLAESASDTQRNTPTDIRGLHERDASRNVRNIGEG